MTKVEWQNPHIWVYLDVAGSDGEAAPWECEGDNPNNLTRRGWTKDSVEVGKPITIYGFQGPQRELRLQRTDVGVRRADRVRGGQRRRTERGPTATTLASLAGGERPMSTRAVSFVFIATLATGTLGISAGTAAGQSTPVLTEQPPGDGTPIPRAPDGRADLSGFWNKGTHPNTSGPIEPLPFTEAGLKAFNEGRDPDRPDILLPLSGHAADEQLALSHGDRPVARPRAVPLRVHAQLPGHLDRRTGASADLAHDP